jgi:hypothetical protein
MNQRIDIINSSRILSTSKSKPLQSRINNSLWLIVIFSILSIVSILGVLFSMIVDWFNLNFNLNWSTSSTVVISSIFCLVFLSESLYSYLFLKHIKKTNSKILVKNVSAINTELEQIVSNKLVLTSNKPVFILGLIIFLVAIVIKVVDTNFLYLYIWSYFKIPLLVFYILFFRQAIKNLILIKRNNLLFEITCLKD